MAAISTHTTSAFTHANGGQDDYATWDHTSITNDENTSFSDYNTNGTPHDTHNLQNGSNYYDHHAIDPYSTPRESRSSSRAGPQPKTKRATDGTILTYDDENSKWIHRDKLAKIESEELQRAGIVLPKTRTQSRSRRDRSQDKASGQRRGTTDSSDQQPLPRSRKNSEPSRERVSDVEVPSWDLRLPEEIAEDPGEYWVAPESGKGTRIPVAKLSPLPLPVDYLDRNAPVMRKPSFGLLDDETSIKYPKTRSRSSSIANALEDSPQGSTVKRSVTEGSPKKSTAAPRKASASSKQTTTGRPKTRSGSAARSTSTTRPSTRSGELSPRAPEGDPPWMISAYRPDPRLPPDQQLLPTVARRLQQEKWEQEGKFGSVYDKDFRPLNDEALAQPPELQRPAELEVEERQDEWPLKPEARVPTPSRPGTSSYSTMPKIQDKPAMSPLNSPKSVQQLQNQNAGNARIPDAPEEPTQEKPKDRGCGCCVVM